MPWHGLVTFNVLNVFPDAPLANWCFTAISAVGMVSFAVKLYIRIWMTE